MKRKIKGRNYLDSFTFQKTLIELHSKSFLQHF